MSKIGKNQQKSPGTNILHRNFIERLKYENRLLSHIPAMNKWNSKLKTQYYLY